MATLEDLVKVDGVVAAGEFKRDGTLVDYRANMDMSPQLAAQAAQFCATVSMLFDTLGGAFEGISSMPWTPQQGGRTAAGSTRWRSVRMARRVSSSRPRKPISTSCSDCS